MDYFYLQTVKENTKFLTKEEIARAFKARKYQFILCCPSKTSYINIVENNMITNFDINSYDIKRADNIWGTVDSVLQGKKGKKLTQKNIKTDTTSICIKTT